MSAEMPGSGGEERIDPLCVVMPLGFVLLALSAQYWSGVLSPAHISARCYARWNVAQGRRAIVAAVVIAFIGLNAAATDWRQPLLLSRPPEVESNQRNVEYAHLVRELTTPSAKVAVVWAGTTPYFCRT